MELQLQEEKRIQSKYPGLLAAMKKNNPSTFFEAFKTIFKYGQLDTDTIVEESMPLYCCYQWRKHRVIYHIDTALAEELLEQTKRISDTESLPCELLWNLPYECIAVEMPPLHLIVRDKETDKESVMDFTGRFYLYYEPEAEYSNWINGLCGLWELPDGDLVNYYVPLHEGWTIKEVVDALAKDFEKAGMHDLDEIAVRAQLMPSLVAIQVVLYLQSQNADIEKQPTTKSPKKKKSTRKTKTVSRGQTPPEIVRVGYRVGKTLRAYRKSAHVSTGTGSTKRPHSRRGHWHHFWTGSKSDPESRKLVIKWVAPMMIHKDKDYKTTTILTIK